MDSRFLKLMGETLFLYASDLEALEEIEGTAGVEKAARSGFGKCLPTGSRRSCSFDQMDECYREWLFLLGAVPKSDLEALEKKVAALEEECHQLTRSLDMVVQGLSGAEEMPAPMNQWVDLAKTITAVHREWLEDFRSRGDKPDEKHLKKHGTNSKKLG